MSNYLVTDTELTQTAAALRTKGGTSEQIEWGSGTGFKRAIEALPSGGGGTSFSDSVSLAPLQSFYVNETVGGYSIASTVTITPQE